MSRRVHERAVVQLHFYQAGETKKDVLTSLHEPFLQKRYEQRGKEAIDPETIAIEVREGFETAPHRFQP